MTLICSFLNEKLVSRYGDDLYITFIDPVPKDRAARTTEMQASVASQPILTVNEARDEFMGLGPVDGGDTLMKPQRVGVRCQRTHHRKGPQSKGVLPLCGKQALSLPRCNRQGRRRVCVRVPLRSPKGTALPWTGENRQYKRFRRLWRSFSSPFPGSDPAEMRAFRVDLRIVQKSSCFSKLNGGTSGVRT
jgi:hypothetical protein